MREQITAKLAELTTERGRFADELNQARLRVQYVETMLCRLDGACAALQSILDAPGIVHDTAPEPFTPVAS